MYIGIDVGNTNISGGLADESGKLIAKTRRQADRAGGAVAGFNLIADIITELMNRAYADGQSVDQIGIGFGGPVDHVRGMVLLSHQTPGWENKPLREELETRFCLPVALDNDANAATLGEWKFGAGRGVDDLLYVNVGTGIGGGLIVNGQLARGKRNLAGEIGHMIIRPNGPVCTCGRRGCLEACASGDALARRGTEALERRVTGKELFTLATEGDQMSRRVLTDIIEDLAHGIGNAVSLLDPAMVIIGGGLSEAPAPFFIEPLRRAIPRYCIEAAAEGLRVELAELRYDAGIMGAVALAMASES